MQKTVHTPNSHEQRIDVFNGDTTYGISIVGMGQAGKTTLRNGITKAWKEELDDRATIVHFSNSDGFRGLTADMLSVAGVSDEVHSIHHDEAEEIINKFVEIYGICPEQLNDYYHNPKPNSVWRTNAVNTFVAYVSEHELVRPEVNKAGARFMKEIVDDPSIMRLDKRPDLFVLDARNIQECVDKFKGAGIECLGSFILLCDERVVVRRTENTFGLTFDERVSNLRERNATDRNRRLGAMSLPKDFAEPINIAKAVLSKDEIALFCAGRKSTMNLERSPLVLDTANTKPEQTIDAMSSVLAGMVHAVNVRS